MRRTLLELLFSRRNAPAFAILLALVGCGGPAGGVAHGGTAADAPPAVTDENVHEIERAFWRMDPEDPDRAAWRDALIAYRSSRTSTIIASGDYDEVVAHLADLCSLLTPSDVEAGRIPSEIAPLARWIVEHGGRRGDEGRVMGALVLLAALGDDADARRAERDRIAEWGRSARARIASPVERYGDLIRVWEQYEELAPAPDVLAALARLYVEQRSALAAASTSEGRDRSSMLSLQDLRLARLIVQRAPLEVAAVYLRHGDLERAIDQVRRMGDRSQMERELVLMLQRAQQNDEGGARALDELARGFARGRPNVAAAICRLGARRFPQDARFPLCLARLAVEDEEPGAATVWYAEAVRLAPGDREVYDEALGRLGQMIEQGVFESSVAQSRGIARHALEILEERTRRFQDAGTPPPLTHAALLVSIARAEMAHGNVSEARERLTASLAVRETREAHEELGLLLERIGQPREAADHYRRALDLVEDRGTQGLADRAEILEHLGDAFRQSGEQRQAERMYTQALEHWNDLLRVIEGARVAIVHVRRGVLLSRLGDAAQAEQAFGAALDASPAWREPYAAMLAHLVTARPNPELAHRVLRRAQYQISLEPEWKVYFALWVQAIARRASAEPEREVTHLFEDAARNDSWSARLAAYGRGELDYDGLLRAASNRGERAEAQFYEGARLLGAGDIAGARQLFRSVIETGMVGFYEYAMAQELLTAMADGAAAGSAEARRAAPKP